MPWLAMREGVPADLWSETGERLWLRYDLADTPERAKRIAFVGRGLPETFLGGERYGYDYLTVREVTCRPGEDDEEGWAGRGADTWWACEPDHPKAARFWEIGVRPSQRQNSQPSEE